MTQKTLKPVIFLAFANDRMDSSRYLRNLSEEKRRVFEKLKKAEDDGLCELVPPLESATPDEVFDVFDSRRYRERIVIFHFAGHAGDYHLAFESRHGETALAHAEGLAAFLGRQNSLKLVFLNGCSTEPQVENLLKANVPAVIATSQAIDDRVASMIATRFYSGLAGGDTISEAFHTAANSVQTVLSNQPRDLYIGGYESDRWPWQLYVKPGASAEVEEWNLPKVVGNPLFPLPPLPHKDLPKELFKKLTYFRVEDAEIFFGRGWDIRKLYDKVTAANEIPLVLLYGTTGVGKSSLLAAGLTPRLISSHTVVYARKERGADLIQALRKALSDDGGVSSVASLWHALEKRLERPVVIILDQVESVFVQIGENQPREIEAFLDTIAPLFKNIEQQPKGKLILGFRKEWLAEIENALKARLLPYSNVFLKPLDQKGVIEAITCPAESPRLRHFGLSIEPYLADTIASDLCEDPNSPIAPTLQILLSKMWDKAVAESHGSPSFTFELYLKLKREGTTLKDFLDQSLDALKKDFPEVVASGLALDLLEFHTTTLGTAKQRTRDEIDARYGHHANLNAILQKCMDLYLLVPINPSNDGDDNLLVHTLSLSHDTLSPLVRDRFDTSDKPGQRARRIIENRAVDWKNEQGPLVTDEEDLKRVDAGRFGMRALDDNEKAFIKASHNYRAKLDKDRRRRWLVLSGAVGGGLTLGLLRAFTAVLTIFSLASNAQPVGLAFSTYFFVGGTLSASLIAGMIFSERFVRLANVPQGMRRFPQFDLRWQLLAGGTVGFGIANIIVLMLITDFRAPPLAMLLGFPAGFGLTLSLCRPIPLKFSIDWLLWACVAGVTFILIHLIYTFLYNGLYMYIFLRQSAAVFGPLAPYVDAFSVGVMLYAGATAGLRVAFRYLERRFPSIRVDDQSMSLNFQKPP